MASVDPNIFRAYDIRGKAHTQITSEACELIGKGFGSILIEMYGESPNIVVGRDARTHGKEFEQSIINGLVSTGCNVHLIGQTPSPVNYFTICNEKLDAGVQITASHNPKEDNGIKLQIRDAEAFAGDDLQTLKNRISEGSFVSGAGEVHELDGITPYVERLVSSFKRVGDGLSIGIDSGNGVAGPLYKEVLEKVGCTVYGLFIEPDGEFPNHPADPSKHSTLADLQKLVKTESLNLGFAYDGDGDRVGLVDENSKIITADEVLLMLAKDHLQRFPSNPVIFTVSNSGTLHTEIEKWGGKPVMCKVGHSYVEHAMRDNNALLGGEQSGHFFCAEEYFGFDDALVTTLRLLSIFKNSGKSVSELCLDFPKVFQSPEQRPFCPDDAKASIIESVIKHFSKEYPVETMDGARIDFGEGGWAGIRMSNTSPCLSICIEARSRESLQNIEQIVQNHLNTYNELK